MTRTQDVQATNDSTPGPVKQPYEPPRIEESGGFERLVLACSHKAGTEFCDSNGTES